MPRFDLILKKGRVVDPAQGVNAVLDLAITHQRIAAVEPAIPPSQAKTVIDLSGKTVVPGIIDPHVHIRTVGHRNMAKVGVVTAVDVAASMDDVLQSTKTFGAGMNIAAVTSIHHYIKTSHPRQAELNAMVDAYLTSGALGVKVLQEPLPHETILNAIAAANQQEAYVKVDCGVTEEGSNLLGLTWLVDAVGQDLHVDIAHINSYCRGQIKDPLEEALAAIRLLEGRRNLQSESYLGVINGTSGQIVNGVPLNGCTRDCLRLGGYPATAEGMKQAFLDGYAKVPADVGGETVLLEGVDAVNAWLATDQRTVCFPVNRPSITILLATQKDARQAFVVNALSTDGGATPRNLLVSSGLALVRYGALTLSDFVRKTALNPSRMYGLREKGSLGVDMDADITVLDLERGKAVMGIALGQVIMVDGVVVGRGGTILTTTKGVPHVAAAGLPVDVIDLHQCGLYT